MGEGGWGLGRGYLVAAWDLIGGNDRGVGGSKLGYQVKTG